MHVQYMSALYTLLVKCIWLVSCTGMRQHDLKKKVRATIAKTHSTKATRHEGAVQVSAVSSLNHGLGGVLRTGRCMHRMCKPWN